MIQLRAWMVTAGLLALTTAAQAQAPIITTDNALRSLLQQAKDTALTPLPTPTDLARLEAEAEQQANQPLLPAWLTQAVEQGIAKVQQMRGTKPCCEAVQPGTVKGIDASIPPMIQKLVEPEIVWDGHSMRAKPRCLGIKDFIQFTCPVPTKVITIDPAGCCSKPNVYLIDGIPRSAAVFTPTPIVFPLQVQDQPQAPPQPWGVRNTGPSPFVPANEMNAMLASRLASVEDEVNSLRMYVFALKRERSKTEEQSSSFAREIEQTLSQLSLMRRELKEWKGSVEEISQRVERVEQFRVTMKLISDRIESYLHNDGQPAASATKQVRWAQPAGVSPLPRFESPDFEVHCEKMTHRGDMVVFEGNVMLLSKKHAQPMRINAHRVILNMKDGSYTVESARQVAPVSSFGVLRTSAMQLDHSAICDKMEPEAACALFSSLVEQGRSDEAAKVLSCMKPAQCSAVLGELSKTDARAACMLVERYLRIRTRSDSSEQCSVPGHAVQPPTIQVVPLPPTGRPEEIPVAPSWQRAP